MTQCRDDSCDQVHCGKCGTHTVGYLLQGGLCFDCCLLLETEKTPQQNMLPIVWRDWNGVAIEEELKLRSIKDKGTELKNRQDKENKYFDTTWTICGEMLLLVTISTEGRVSVYDAVIKRVGHFD